MTIIAPADLVPFPCPMYVSRERPLPKLATNSSGVPSLHRAFLQCLESLVGDGCIPKRIRYTKTGYAGVAGLDPFAIFPEAVAGRRFQVG